MPPGTSLSSKSPPGNLVCVLLGRSRRLRRSVVSLPALWLAARIGTSGPRDSVWVSYGPRSPFVRREVARKRPNTVPGDARTGGSGMGFGVRQTRFGRIRGTARSRRAGSRRRREPARHPATPRPARRALWPTGFWAWAQFQTGGALWVATGGTDGPPPPGGRQGGRGPPPPGAVGREAPAVTEMGGWINERAPKYPPDPYHTNILNPRPLLEGQAT